MEKELLVDEMRKQWGLPGLSDGNCKRWKNCFYKRLWST